MRNTGYATHGASAKNAIITAVAMRWCAIPPARDVAPDASSWTADISRTPSSLRAEEARRLDHQHDRHDYEDHRVRRLRIEHLGQALDHPEREAGHDRAHDRAHASDHDHREDHDDQVGSHERIDLVERRRHHARES